MTGLFFGGVEMGEGAGRDVVCVCVIVCACVRACVRVCVCVCVCVFIIVISNLNSVRIVLFYEHIQPFQKLIAFVH